MTSILRFIVQQIHVPGVAKKNKYIAFTLYRILRQKICNARVREQNTKSGKSASNERPGMYDTVGDNSGYQELGYVSEPSHYERL